MDYYAILGVHPTAEDVVIRAAYKALAQRYHPDRYTGPQDEAHRKMSELTKAYDVLADPVRRQKYDRRRLTYTQSVTTYFNGSARFPPPMLDPRELRSAAAKRKRSRIALSALMVAVVVLSVFNLVQYSGQIKDWLSASLPAATIPTAADSGRIGAPSVAPQVGVTPAAAPRSAAAAGIPGASTEPSSAAAASFAEAQSEEGSGENTPRQAVAGAATLVPDAGAAAAPSVATTAVAVPPAAVTAVAVPPAAVTPVAAPPAAVTPVAAPPAAVTAVAVPPAAVTPVAAPPAGASAGAVPPGAATAVAVQPAKASPLMGDRRAGAAPDRAPSARSSPVDRPITSSPAASASDGCRDAVAALGLCTPNTTARNR